MKIPAPRKSIKRRVTSKIASKSFRIPLRGKTTAKPDRAPKTAYKPTFIVEKKAPRVLQASTLKPGMERLERHMAHTGLASRREAKALIVQGVVLVNGKIAKEPGMGINPEKDIVTIKGEHLPEKETIMLFKPRGVETNATNGESDIRTRYPRLAHLSPVGRLDKDSSGLIMLSNDGTLARAMTKENSTVEKEYLVTTREEVSDVQLKRMADGIILDGIPTKPAIVERRGRSVFSIVLTEGRKHQIRRMCDACHLTITTLVRIRIGHLKAGPMIAGNVRSVAPKDVEKLKQS
jgi:pseudouridine synthase